MTIMAHIDRAAFITKQVDHDGHVSDASRLGDLAPFEVTRRAGVRVVAACLGARYERLGGQIRLEQRHPARCGMLVGRRDGAREIGTGGRVADRIVQEDAGEHAPKSDGAHVALDVLARRVQSAT